MTSAGLPDIQQKNAFNFGVIARHDSQIAQLYYCSAICNVYKFDIETGEWDKRDCQGSLFIYSRNTRSVSDYPFGLVVLNRLNLENFMLGIRPISRSASSGEPDMEVNSDDTFIMVQAADGAMYGLWLFDESDRPKVLSLLKWCLEQ